LQRLTSDVNSKLEQRINENKAITKELTNKIVHNRNAVNEKLTALDNEVECIKD
jgi:predicted nuclease with TOPRIM domain